MADPNNSDSQSNAASDAYDPTFGSIVVEGQFGNLVLVDMVMGPEEITATTEELLETYEAQLLHASDLISGAFRTRRVTQNPIFPGVAGPINKDSIAETSKSLTGMMPEDPGDFNE